MARQITQRELRNESGEIMRALGRGESFVVTRNGVPVGELIAVSTSGDKTPPGLTELGDGQRVQLTYLSRLD